MPWRARFAFSGGGVPWGGVFPWTPVATAGAVPGAAQGQLQGQGQVVAPVPQHIALQLHMMHAAAASSNGGAVAVPAANPDAAMRLMSSLNAVPSAAAPPPRFLPFTSVSQPSQQQHAVFATTATGLPSLIHVNDDALRRGLTLAMGPSPMASSAASASTSASALAAPGAATQTPVLSIGVPIPVPVPVPVLGTDVMLLTVPQPAQPAAHGAHVAHAAHVAPPAASATTRDNKPPHAHAQTQARRKHATEVGTKNRAASASASGRGHAPPRARGGKNKQRAGRWTKREHDRFLKGLAQYGPRWTLVTRVVESRSAEQVRSHAQKYFIQQQKKKEAAALGGAFHAPARFSVPPPLMPTASGARSLAEAVVVGAHDGGENGKDGDVDVDEEDDGELMEDDDDENEDEVAEGGDGDRHHRDDEGATASAALAEQTSVA